MRHQHLHRPTCGVEALRLRTLHLPTSARPVLVVVPAAIACPAA